MRARVQFKLTPQGLDTMRYGVSRTGRSCFEMSRGAGRSRMLEPPASRMPLRSFFFEDKGPSTLIKDNLQYWIATPPFRLLRVGQISPFRM
ncbi:hypothetical protein ACVIRO_003470 [Rhizobium ruizarguesonis]|jgi:hypothetical protein